MEQSPVIEVMVRHSHEEVVVNRVLRLTINNRLMNRDRHSGTRLYSFQVESIGGNWGLSVGDQFEFEDSVHGITDSGIKRFLEQLIVESPLNESLLGEYSLSWKYITQMESN